MTWKKIKSKLDDIDKAEMKACITYVAAPGTKTIVVGRRVEQSYEKCFNLFGMGTGSMRVYLTIYETSVHPSGVFVKHIYQIPTDTIIDINEVPF